jgi:hypothetical protein
MTPHHRLAGLALAAFTLLGCGSQPTQKGMGCDGATVLCSCGMYLQPNANPCNETAPLKAVCCADPGWPAEGKGCVCDLRTCQKDSTGYCSCYAGVAAGSGTNVATCTPGTGFVCCQKSNGDCDCVKQAACGTGTTQVNQCDAATIKCGSATTTGATQVTDCRMGQ